MKRILLGSALVLGITSSVYAQYTPPPPPTPFPGFLNEYMRKQDPYLSAWDIGGSWRLRYEVKENGGSFPATDFRADGVDNDNSYLLSKVRLRVGYTDKWWSAFVEGRSSTSTGDDRNPNPESDTDLHQAYVTLGNHKEFPLSLKIGRQELSYGDERLVGAFAWNNIGRVFDAAKVRWQNEYFAADFFSGRVIIPDDNNFNLPNDYDWFSGMYLTTKLIPKQATEFYVLSRNVGAASPATIGAGLPGPLTGAGPRDIYTVGLRMKSNPADWGNWDYGLEIAGQFGHYNDAALPAAVRSLEHQALAAVVGGGYTWKDTFGTPRVGLEYNYASGDSNPTDGKHETFENLFPTNHKFYGYMDFLSWQNLHDFRGIFSLKPHPRLSTSLEYHAYMLADTSDSLYAVNGARRGGIATTPGTGYGINPSYGNYIGSEIDLIAGYALTKFATIEGGYGHFFVGDYVKESLSATPGGSTDADYVYLQLTVNF